MQQIIFYILASVAVLSAVMVISSKNPVRAVLFLVLTFFMSAATWMLLEVEFLAITLVLVYVGAVMVLFLFVVMMLDIEIAVIKEGFIRYLPVGICLPVLLIILLNYGVGPQNFGSENVQMPIAYAADYSNVKALGELLFTKYIYQLELAGVILLVAIIAAISLAFRGKRNRKTQILQQQTQVKKADRLKIIKDLGA